MLDWRSRFVKVLFIVVLTTHDMLIDRIKNKVKTELQDICIGPSKKFAGLDMPHAGISSMYENSDIRRRLSEDARQPDPHN
jgi:hypothetical protein